MTHHHHQLNSSFSGDKLVGLQCNAICGSSDAIHATRLEQQQNENYAEVDELVNFRKKQQQQFDEVGQSCDNFSTLLRSSPYATTTLISLNGPQSSRVSLRDKNSVFNLWFFQKLHFIY